MANLGKWGTTTLTTVMTTELNALANGASATSSSAYDNTTNLDMFADFELFINNVAAGSLNTTQRTCSLFLLTSVDGTNFDNGVSGLISYVGVGGVSSSHTVRIYIRNVMIPPTKFKFLLGNNIGQALGATGNTLKILTYSYNLNG